MDMITFDTLTAEYRKTLEARMRRVETVRNNLTRMVEEAITTINKRAEEDKEHVSELFTALISQQEQEIMFLRGELGIGVEKPHESAFAVQDEIGPAPIADFKPFTADEQTEPPRMTPGIKRKVRDV